MPAIASLECARCHQHVPVDLPRAVCTACGGPLYVRYDLEALKRDAARPSQGGVPSMWRYSAVLPDVEPVTLSEGWTPMLRSRRYPQLYIKDEGANPAGTVKARGASMVASMARRYGVKKLAASSAGNTAGALAAYAAAAGLEAHLFMPEDAPFASRAESAAFGAHVTLVDGTVSDCARMVTERTEAEGWFDASGQGDPFRIEGEKTMGYELVEQLEWEYPDAVIYPAGSETELAGIWKAFEEMEALGWVQPGKRPKLIVVRASTVSATGGTVAPGLPASQPPSVSAVVDIPRAWEGTSTDIDNEAILASRLDWARNEGMLLGMEGAAATAAYDRLLKTKFLTPSDRVVLFNTTSGFKYADMSADAMKTAPSTNKKKLPERSPVGGIITPV